MFYININDIIIIIVVIISGRDIIALSVSLAWVSLLLMIVTIILILFSVYYCKYWTLREEIKVSLDKMAPFKAESDVKL